VNRTALFEYHKNSGARLIEFHNWEMPVYYTSIKQESLAVRNNAGVFDVSHMGNIFITGNEAQKFVDYIITNSVADKKNGKVIYSPICNENGFILDDILVYKFSEKKFLLIVNASNKDKVLNWLIKNSQSFDVKIDDISEEYSLIAIQGPKSSSILNKFINLDIDSIPYYTFCETKFLRYDCIISRTGYTGEKGFEILIENRFASAIWENILNNKNDSLPCGLGARDVLRIEAGFPLYGQELTENINPFETNLARFVKLEKDDFIGKQALKSLKNSYKNTRIGFVMKLNRIARTDNEIYAQDNNKIGWVSSGTFSFYLNKSIGMGFIDKNFVDLKEIKIKINDKFYEAEITSLPFIKLRVN